ncbi:MFS transporter [Actinotalea ferrariae]|uniref:MFS transporter n=1 Tax=Actinotalea ferrariae TaxID=1386098 RepID=UPI001C8C39DF|nr:MFS transporter [Actinotalea ferrariae]MBX9245245.1 MFS transporter [Actinotalea ferrariae]
MSTDRAPAAERPRLVRDRLTLTLYAPFITWGWFLYGFSPAVPLIADEQGITRGQAGLHGTAMACGTIAAGLVSSHVARRFGRKNQAILGGVVLCAGIVLLLTGATLPATLVACLVTAVGGNLMISAAQPALSVHNGAAGPAAVTEANAMGAMVGLLAPLALGAAVGSGLGWRPAVALVAVLAVAAALLLLPIKVDGAMGRGSVSRAVATAADGSTTAPSRGFSGTFWFFWVAMLCGVAIEFATTFWASDLLAQRTDAPPALAAASISALVAGMTLSRLVVGPLSTRKAPEKILLVGFALAGAGWLLFWLATSPWLAVAGLVLAGLGYGTHYPLTISLTLRASDGRPDEAQARASVGTGAAVAVAPFLLGTLADSFGAHQAFLLVPVLIVIGGVAVALGLRSVHRR